MVDGFRWFSLRKRCANVIDAGTKITGDIHAQNHLTIFGTLDGDLVVLGDVRIGPSAEITGNVSGENVWVAGKIKGNVRATSHLVIFASGSIDGEIEYKSIECKEGAVISGPLKHDAAPAGPDVPVPQTVKTVKEEDAAATMKRQLIVQPSNDEPIFPVKNKRILIH